MAKSAALAAPNKLARTPLQKFWVRFKKNWQLHLMVLLPLAYMILFHYVPMYGITIAFKEYSPRAGIWGSPWVGLKHYENFFGYYLWPQLVMNTLSLSLYSIFVGFPIPVILALVLHVHTGKVIKKIAQNISYVPHFISLVVMVGILQTVLDPVSGFIGYFNRLMGSNSYDDIRGSKEAFRHLFVWSGIWQTAGWSTIIYVSALSGVSEDLHEAAKIDGASRLRRVFSVDFPTILPTVALMLIMRFGSVMSVGYQKAYLMQNQSNIAVSEIISTYVYKQGLRKGEMSFGTAVGLLNSVINVTLVFLVNWVTNILTDNEMGLF